MGTNFYWVTPADDLPEEHTLPTGETVWLRGRADDDPKVHIGKRSAAGLFCWDCSETLVIGGRGAIHQGSSGNYDACPKCGAPPIRETLSESAPMSVELGFSPPRPERPTGVRGTSSFTWAQDPDRVRAICAAAPADAKLIRDEYGRRLTGQGFLDMLRANCGVEFMDMIGRAFS